MTQPLQPISQQQRDTVQRLSPEFLSHGIAERLLYAMGLGSDVVIEKRNQGVQATFPLDAPPTALPLLANDMVLVQGPNEPDAAFAIRLSQSTEAWSIAGNRWSILQQVQAYLSTPTPIYAAQLPECLIVGGNGSVSTWDTIYTTTPAGAPPAHAAVAPANWNWDGASKHWRSWLILFMSLLPVGLSGTAASLSSAAGGSSLGRLVSGVWVPGITPINAPFVTVTGLSGMSSTNVQQYLTVSGGASSGNNGTFQITAVPSATSAVIANPNNVTPDANNGALVWSVGHYPIVAPGPVWGAPGFLWGDTTRSLGLSCAPGYVSGIRSLLRQWKSANTYYPYLIVAFDGADGRAGSEFSPWSSQGSGNPDGSWGSPGKNVSGVWAPARATTSPFDAFCGGTGQYVQCNVHNVT